MWWVVSTTPVCQNPQSFPNKLFERSQTSCLSGCQSRAFGQTQHATWHWNAIITGMFARLWDVQAAKREEWTMAVSSRACHRGGFDWHMLGHITGAGVDGGLPWDFQPSAMRKPPPWNWVKLGLGSASSPFTPALVPMQVLVEWKERPEALDGRPQPFPKRRKENHSQSQTWINLTLKIFLQIWL